MPIFHEAPIEAAVAEGRKLYEKQRDSLPPGWQRAYYDFCARVSPEISRWAMQSANAGLMPKDVCRAFHQGMAAIGCSVLCNMSDDVPAAFLDMLEAMEQIYPAMLSSHICVATTKKMDS